MRSSVQALKRDIADIQAMALSIDPVNQLLQSSSDANVRAYLRVRRRFDYSALIVALYAAFEKFVEDIVSSYAEKLSGRGTYNSLPNRLTGKHLTETAYLLGKTTIDGGRYPGVTHLQLAENLFKCLSGESVYRLNHVAITAHDNNLRYDELGSLLGVIDLKHEEVRSAGPLLDWYRAAQPTTDPTLKAVPRLAVQPRLDNLVERRNDIAHRGGNPTERMGGDEMGQLIDFIWALAQSIFIVFVAEYLRKHHIDGANCVQLERTDGPFDKLRVWVVKPTSIRLCANQPIFALSNGFLVRWGRIESLKIDEVDHASIEPGGDKDIGVKFGFAAPKSANLYVLGQEDELIWPPAEEQRSGATA